MKQEYRSMFIAVLVVLIALLTFSILDAKISYSQYPLRLDQIQELSEITFPVEEVHFIRR